MISHLAKEPFIDDRFTGHEYSGDYRVVGTVGTTDHDMVWARFWTSKPDDN